MKKQDGVQHSSHLFPHSDGRLLSTVKRGGGSVIALAAISWDSLGLTITAHRRVMAKVYEAISQDYCSCTVFCGGFMN